MPESDFIDDVLDELEDDEVSGFDSEEDDGDEEEMIAELVEVGAIDEVGAARVRSTRGRKGRRRLLRNMLRKQRRRIPRGARGLPSPPFGRSARDTERRAPLGFIEDGSGAFFFTLPAVIGGTTTMRAKVSRAAHPDRLLIVPSAPGAVLQSAQVGDEEQLLAPGAPVELYSTAALTDQIPDNFSPIGPALDFVIVLTNTTAVAITGTIGIKAAVKR